jgi:hypothetical protein
MTLVGELCNFVVRGVALNLDGCHNNLVTNGVKHRVAGFVDSFSVRKAAIFDKKSEDGLGEGDTFTHKLHILCDGGSVIGAEFRG